MKNNLLVFVLMLLSVLSCKKKEEVTPGLPETTPAVAENDVFYEDCYVYYSGGDKILLQFTKNGNKVTGALDYALAEKDANVGTFKGFMKGDTILADYTFTSEGKNSVREIAFLFEDNQFLEGSGEVTVKGDTVRFADKGKLQFNTTMPLQKTDCK